MTIKIIATQRRRRQIIADKTGCFDARFTLAGRRRTWRKLSSITVWAAR